MTEKANSIITKSEDSNHTWLRAEERERLETEYDNEKQNAQQAKVFGVGSGANSIQAMRGIKSRLDRETPPDMDGATKDIINNKIQALEEKIQRTMPTKETMRRNPAGAVHENTQHHQLTKRDQILWKNLKKVIEPDSEDPDLCNLEILRPSIIQRGGTSTFMADAQISGHSALSESVKENVPDFMDKVVEGSALGQIQAVEESVETAPKKFVTSPSGKTRKVPSYEPRVCACGCDKMFTPHNIRQKYESPNHRSTHHARMQAEKKKEAKTQEAPTVSVGETL